jgi:hypothetical protein
MGTGGGALGGDERPVVSDGKGHSSPTVFLSASSAMAFMPPRLSVCR